MKSRERLIRLKRFQVDEKRRQVAQIESMIAEFERMAADLDVKSAPSRSGAAISDAAHFAYPTFAKAAMQRRDNLVRSAGELKTQLADARTAFDEALEELKKVEALDERDHDREHSSLAGAGPERARA